MTEFPLIRGGEFCGLHFSLRGPRNVRLDAIWAADQNVVYLYDARGTPGAMSTALRAGVRELVWRAGGLIPPDIRAKELAAACTHQPRRRTPGINPGARGALFLRNSLIRSTEFPDSLTALRAGVRELVTANLQP
jgi:hypothetical protein